MQIIGGREVDAEDRMRWEDDNFSTVTPRKTEAMSKDLGTFRRRA